MKLNEALNRTFNLLGTSIVALAGFAFTAEIFLENDWPDKIDDITLFVLAIVGIIWYLMGNNKYKRSIVPVVLIILSLLAKIMAVIIERDDKDAVGDDFGGLTLFVISTVLILYQYFKTKKLTAAAENQ